MDSAVGKIIAIGPGGATIEVARTAACSRCAAGKGCGAGLLGSSRASALLEVPLSPASDLCEGDEVRLALEPAHLLRATMLVYGLPLLGIVLSLTAGWLISRPLSDAVAVIYAVAGLAAGLYAGRRLLSRHECLTQFIPSIEGRADAGPERS